MIFAAAVAVAAGSLILGSISSVQAAPKRGGILTHVVESEPNTIDCHASGTSFTMQLMSIHYSTLLDFDPEHYPQVRGDLAESWKISDDGKTYTFKLHPGVQFHDGTILTSADIKATYERLQNPPKGIVSVRKAQFADITSIETPDDLTVKFTLRRPNPAMIAIFASPWNCVYSAKKLAQDPNYPAKEPMGTGPFVFEKYVKGSYWLAKRFDHYFKKGEPYLDGVKAVFIRGAGVINALAGGQVDATFFLISPANAERLKAQRGDSMTFPKGPFNITNFVSVNTTKPPFDDVRVRKALQMALDRRQGYELMKKISNTDSPSLLMPKSAPLRMTEEEIAALPGYGGDMAKTRAAAKKLLKEAGHPNLKVTVLNRNIRTPWEPLGVFVIDQLRQIGVQADQILADTPQYFSRLRSKNFDIAIDFNNTLSVDPNEVLVKFLPGSPNNYTYAKDPVLTELYEKQFSATSDAARLKYVKAFEKRVYDQAYTLTMFRGGRLVAVSSYVKGWHLMPSTVFNLDMSEVWLDK